MSQEKKHHQHENNHDHHHDDHNQHDDNHVHQLDHNHDHEHHHDGHNNDHHDHDDHHHNHDHDDHHHDHHHDHDHDDDYDNEFDVYPQEFLPYFENPNFQGRILDVRETWEREQAYIEGSVSIPLQQLFHKFSELDKNEAYFVLCTQGFRSSYAVAFLLSQGFEKVVNIQTGLNGMIEFLQEQNRDVPKWFIWNEDPSEE